MKSVGNTQILGLLAGGIVLFAVSLPFLVQSAP
jgi:hypothetical protein